MQHNVQKIKGIKEDMKIKQIGEEIGFEQRMLKKKNKEKIGTKKNIGEKQGMKLVMKSMKIDNQFGIKQGVNML
ncbi:unnamed protein product [Paramecium octaurelia]|uniref:Uncharacterized protein n=1 Tax=Paramecium octaurelia TaxID=43137 RepID=A0A8S1YLM9_PAROT|nr:unnamed protein product [Paramecium octaurelia]